MSRGRKPAETNIVGWENVFYNSVGSYVQYINLELGKEIKAEPLSNHIRIVGGYAFKSSLYKQQGVPVIRISDFSNEKIVLDDVVYYEESEGFEKYELHEGDIVIALTGGTIAKLGIVQKGIGKLYLNQRVGKFEVLNPDEFEAEYVYWIARSVQNIIKNLAWGAAIPNVSPKQIEELEFPIPDKETQRGIIDFLNDLKANAVEEDREYFNRRIEENIITLQKNQMLISEINSEIKQQQEFLKLLRNAFSSEAMKGNLIKQDLSDGTATELLENIRIEKEKLIAEKKIRREKETTQIEEEGLPFDIPVNWNWCRLSELGICQTGTTPSTAKREYFGNDIPFIKPADITLKGLILDNEGLTFSGLKEGVHIPRNSLLMVCIGGSIGKSYFTDIDVSCNQQINTITPLAGIQSSFLQFWMQSDYFQKAVWSKASGGTTPIVNRSKWESILIPLPPLATQNKILEKLASIDSFIDSITESISQSKNENEALQDALLNAILGVKSSYDIARDKTVTEKIKKVYIDENENFIAMSMKIVEILKSSSEPVSANTVWNSSEYKGNNDFEAFYAELKRLIEIEKLVVEEKRGKESFLKLAPSEN